MVMLRDSNADFVDKSIDKYFVKGMTSKPELYSQTLNVLTSKDKQEKMTGVSGLGILSIKTESNEYTADEILQLYDKTFTHDTYGGLVEASLEAVEDDRSGVISKKIQKCFADSMRSTIENSWASMLDNSQTTTGADSKVLCATDHPVNPNTTATYANRPTTNADLTISTLEAGVTAALETVNARNITDGWMPTQLIVAPANKLNGEKILQSKQVPDTANNDKNVISTYGIRLIVNPYLSDTDSWYLVGMKDDHQLIWIWRKRPSYSEDTDTRNDDALFKARARWSVGWVDARGIYGTVGG